MEQLTRNVIFTILIVFCRVAVSHVSQDNTQLKIQQEVNSIQANENNIDFTLINSTSNSTIDIDLIKYSLNDTKNVPKKRKKILLVPFGIWINESNDTDTCEEGSMDDFPKDLFTMAHKRSGAIFLHFVLGVYCFALLAVVCNDYFLPSVEEICKKLDLSEDVAAATFMAIATSAPEFFVNVVGTFVTESDIGIGTIIGSAMFNTLGVAGLGGLAATTYIKIEWWPITRDCIIYVLTVVMLIIMCNDQVIQWYESLILLIFYVVYFIIMWQNKRIYKLIMNIPRLCDRKNNLFTNEKGTSSNNSISSKRKENVDPEIPIEGNESPEDDTVPFTLWSCPEGSAIVKAWWLFSWPIRLILTCTIPDCRKYPKMFPLTFFMCVVWIGTNSYLVSWMIAVIGTTIRIPDFVMGLTFLAAGGCLPEAISIVIVSRKGQGGMGVSNSLGANTLDILLCLGLPWFIKTMISAYKQEDTSIPMDSQSLFYTIIALILAVVVLYVTVSLNGYKLNRKIGIMLMLFYTCFLTTAILLEMYVVYEGKLLPCDT